MRAERFPVFALALSVFVYFVLFVVHSLSARTLPWG